MAYADVAAALTIADSLKQQTWNAKLQEESATGDIFSQNSGIYNDDIKQVPDAIVMKVKGSTVKNTIGMLSRLSGVAQQGVGELRGNEEVQATREMELYANEWFHGVPTAKYGLQKVKQDPYKVYAMAQPQLSMWGKETRGMKIRQALVQRIDGSQSASLTPDAGNGGSTGLALATRINPNFAFGGNSPIVYDSTAADYQTAIVAGISAATVLNKAALDKIEELAASNFELEQVTVDGRLCWVLTVPTRQKTLLRTAGTGTYLELLKDGDVRGSNNRAIANVLGRYGSLVLVEDMRYPIMTNTTGTLSFAYKGAGQADDRNLAAAATRFDLAFLLGKGAVADYEVEALHFEDEVQNYNRNWGIGAFTTQGYTRCDFDNLSSPTDTSIRNQSSAVIALKQS
jgi:hypothetical protein